MNAMPSTTIGISALTNDFRIRGSFDLLSSSSRDPSSTIRIKPIVPKMGSSSDKLGMCKFKVSQIRRTAQPISSRSIAVGILVRFELKSRTYAISNNVQIVMMTSVLRVDGFERPS